MKKEKIELDPDISQGCDDAEQFVKDILTGPDEILRCLTYSLYIREACLKIMESTGMPAPLINSTVENIERIVKQQVDEDLKIV